MVWLVHLIQRRNQDANHTFNRTQYDSGIRYVTEPAVYCNRCQDEEARPPPSLVPVFLAYVASRVRRFPITRCNLCILYKNRQKKLAPLPLGSRVPAMAICISSPCPCSRLDSSVYSVPTRRGEHVVYFGRGVMKFIIPPGTWPDPT